MVIPYKYTHIIIGAIILLVVPMIIFLAKGNIISFIFCILLSSSIGFSIIHKYGNTLYMDDKNIIIKNILFFKKEVPTKEIRGIYIHTEHIFPQDTIYINIKIAHGHKTFHLGTLSSEYTYLLYDYLKNNANSHIETIP